MKDATITLAFFAGFVILMNILAFIVAILFSNWITAGITFTGVVTALFYALFKLIQKEL